MHQSAYPEGMPIILSKNLGLTAAQLEKCIILGGMGFQEDDWQEGDLQKPAQHIEQALHILNKAHQGVKCFDNEDVVLLNRDQHEKHRVESLGSQVFCVQESIYTIQQTRPLEANVLFEEILAALDHPVLNNNLNSSAALIFTSTASHSSASGIETKVDSSSSVLNPDQLIDGLDLLVLGEGEEESSVASNTKLFVLDFRVMNPHITEAVFASCDHSKLNGNPIYRWHQDKWIVVPDLYTPQKGKINQSWRGMISN